MRNPFYTDVNNAQESGNFRELLTSQNSELLRRGQGPQFSTNSDVQGGINGDPHLQTIGNWDAPLFYGTTQNGYSERTTPQSVAVTDHAAMLASKLASNQPSNAQGQNFIQGLANLFGKQQTPEPLDQENLVTDMGGQMSAPKVNFDVDSLLKNQNWNMLYAMDPKKANAAYQTRMGISFDEALKKRQDQKKFIIDTVQSRIAGNQLRQDEVGNWLEMQDTPDDTPGASLGATKKKWAPASLQTIDMVTKAGGAEGLGLTNFKSSDPIKVASQLRSAGWSDEGIKDYFNKNTPQTAKPTGPAAQQRMDAPTPPSGPIAVEGALPYLAKKFYGLTQNNNELMDKNIQMKKNQEAYNTDQAHASMGFNPITAFSQIFKNMFDNGDARLLGGQLTSVPDASTPAPTQEQLLKLRAMLLNH